MLFEYARCAKHREPVAEAATFRVGRLSRIQASGGRGTDFSYLIDSTYDYHSPRELRWHLADRLGLKPAAVALRETA